jgi:hypothetical protein
MELTLHDIVDPALQFLPGPPRGETFDRVQSLANQGWAAHAR